MIITSVSASWNSTIIITQGGENVNIVEFHERKKIGRFIIVVEFHDAMGGMLVKLNDAIIKRIDEICAEKGLNVCDASLRGGMSPSAIYDLYKGRTKCSKVITIKRFCEGAGITLKDFFDREYFNDIVEE